MSVGASASRRPERHDFLQLTRQFRLRQPGVVVGLQPQPPAVGLAEQAAEAEVGVGGDGARFPATMSPMRWAGTPMLLASRYLLMASGARNSSRSISPGETGAMIMGTALSSMIIDNLHILGAFGRPAEAEAKLVVDPHTPLPFAVAAQGLQAIAGRGAHVVQRICEIKLHQLA